MFETVGEAVAKLLTWFFIGLASWIGLIVVVWLLYLIGSVLFFGESSACPQNLC